MVYDPISKKNSDKNTLSMQLNISGSSKIHNRLCQIFAKIHKLKNSISISTSALWYISKYQFASHSLFVTISFAWKRTRNVYFTF